MNSLPTTSGPMDDRGDAPAAQEVLKELTVLLEKQSDLLRTGRLEELSPISQRIHALLRQAESLRPSDTVAYAEQLKQVLELYKKTMLLLKSQREAIRGPIAEVHRGQNALRAYRGSRRGGS